jgi:hypothetical protein
MINLHPEFITKDGQPQFAVIPYDEFVILKNLLEDLEDLRDLRVAKQEEYSQPSLSFQEVAQQLKLQP